MISKNRVSGGACRHSVIHQMNASGTEAIGISAAVYLNKTFPALVMASPSLAAYR